VRARDILPAYDTTAKKTRRLHERGRGTIFAGGQRYTAVLRGTSRGRAYKWLVIHFAPASPDSDSCLPPFRITHAQEATVV